VAIHEAGHAVTAWVVGLTVHEVTIAELIESPGALFEEVPQVPGCPVGRTQVCTSEHWYQAISPYAKKRLRSLAVYYAGGPMAEICYGARNAALIPGTNIRDGHLRDFLLVEELARRMLSPPTDLKLLRFVDHVVHRSHQIVTSHEGAIRSLAEVLLVDETLDKPELRRQRRRLLPARDVS
jgi:hypothetical protein